MSGLITEPRRDAMRTPARESTASPRSVTNTGSTGTGSTGTGSTGTGSTGTAVTAVTGLAHVGVPATETAELVAAVIPTLRDALRAGDSVTAVVGRRTRSLLWDGLGPDADRLASLSPAEILRPGPERLVAALRGEVRRAARRAVVVVEYPAATDPIDVGEWESAADLVLADQPLTLLCGHARGTDGPCPGGSRTDSITAHHPSLLTVHGRHDNPAYRAPVDRSPSPASLWGRRVLRATVADPGNVDRLAERVLRIALSIGLTDADADTAVRAATGAVALAGTAGQARVVELRCRGRQLLVDVAAPSDPGTEHAGVDGLAPGGVVGVHDDGDTRRVMVLCPMPRSADRTPGDDDTEPVRPVPRSLLSFGTGSAVAADQRG